MIPQLWFRLLAIAYYAGSNFIESVLESGGFGNYLAIAEKLSRESYKILISYVLGNG